MITETAKLGQLNLFIEHEWIDTRRVEKILGVSNNTVHRMISSKVLDVFWPNGFARPKVRYHSLVAYCDGLREKYAIPDRRPKLSAPGLRHRDDDLLPFRRSDTINIATAMRLVGTGKDPIYKMIEEGRFEAYRLDLSTPWRISHTSLVRWIEQPREAVYRPGAQPYRRVAE